MRLLGALLLTLWVLVGCTPPEFAAAERLSNERRQQRVVWILDRLEWLDADYLRILEAAEAVEALSRVYVEIRDASLSMQYEVDSFLRLQGAFLIAAREYREAREVVKNRWAEFAPEEQIVLLGWDRDARVFGQAMSDKLLAIADPNSGAGLRAQLWQDTMTLMPYFLAGARALFPMVRAVF